MRNPIPWQAILSIMCLCKRIKFICLHTSIIIVYPARNDSATNCHWKYTLKVMMCSVQSLSISLSQRARARPDRVIAFFVSLISDLFANKPSCSFHHDPTSWVNGGTDFLSMDAEYRSCFKLLHAAN